MRNQEYGNAKIGRPDIIKNGIDQITLGESPIHTRVPDEVAVGRVGRFGDGNPLLESGIAIVGFNEVNDVVAIKCVPSLPASIPRSFDIQTPFLLKTFCIPYRLVRTSLGISSQPFNFLRIFPIRIDCWCP